MSTSPSAFGYYVYSLIVIGIFLFNCRNWAFIRTTVLYFVFITFFAYLLVYGSAYSLESNLSQWHREGLLTVFPFIITGSAPDANTVSRTDPNYFPWMIAMLAFFVTFPQAVVRGVRLRLDREKSPTEVMRNAIQYYNNLQKVLAYAKKPLPFLLGTVSDAYVLGEWIFVLITISSLVSPFPRQSWILMLLGCFFVVLLAGTELAKNNGTKGLVSIILWFFVPGVIAAMQRFAAFMTNVIIFLVCASIALLSGSILFNLIANIMHTQDPGIVVIIISVIFALGVLWVSFAFLSKVILFSIAKLIEWMGIEIVDQI